MGLAVQDSHFSFSQRNDRDGFRSERTWFGQRTIIKSASSKRFLHNLTTNIVHGFLTQSPQNKTRASTCFPHSTFLYSSSSVSIQTSILKINQYKIPYPMEISIEDAHAIMHGRALAGYSLHPMHNHEAISSAFLTLSHEKRTSLFSSSSSSSLLSSQYFKTYDLLVSLWSWIQLKRNFASIKPVNLKQDPTTFPNHDIPRDKILHNLGWIRSNIQIFPYPIPAIKNKCRLVALHVFMGNHQAALKTLNEINTPGAKFLAQILALKMQHRHNFHQINTSSLAQLIAASPKERSVHGLDLYKSQQSTIAARYHARHASSHDIPNMATDHKLIRKALARLNDDDPYLRATLEFELGSSTESILENNPGMLFLDRVGFALKFIDQPSVLWSYLQDNLNQSIATGSLDGLVLIGFGIESKPLLQNYVRREGDIQSACILSVLGGWFVQDWFLEYRALLNSWNLFALRTEFDNESYHILKEKSPSAADALLEIIHCDLVLLEAECYFCNKSLKYNNPARTKVSVRKNTGLLSQGASTAFGRLRISNCPSCQNMVPKCAVCLIPLELSNPIAEKAVANLEDPTAHNNGPNSADYPRGIPFQNFFTWCLVCGHGGHAAHIHEWKQNYNYCPVSDCPCICSDHDANEVKIFEDRRIQTATL